MFSNLFLETCCCSSHLSLMSISAFHLNIYLPTYLIRSHVFWILLVSRNAWFCTTLNSKNNNSKTCRVENILRLHHLSQRVKIYTTWCFFDIATQATLQAIPAALAKAHQVYGVKDSKVVFVMNEDGRNFADWCQVRVLFGLFWVFFFFFSEGKVEGDLIYFFGKDDLMVIVVVVLFFVVIVVDF